MIAREFRPGMRFSATDGLVLMVAGAAVWWWRDDVPWLARVVAFVTVNFFLFCNVFRVSRAGENLWAVVFVALAGYRLQTGGIEWWVIYTVSSLLSVAVIVAAMRQPSYHGLGWSVINPNLKEWWKRQMTAAVEGELPSVSDRL